MQSQVKRRITLYLSPCLKHKYSKLCLTIQQRQGVRRLFFPGPIYLVAEAVLALVILLALNISNIEGRLLSEIPDQTRINPLNYITHIFSQLADSFSEHSWASQLTLFVMWAVMGMLAYLLCFRAIQITTNTTNSLKEGVLYARTDGTTGFMKWFSSLHDYIITFLLKSGGLIMVIVGAFLVFTYANYALQAGLAGIYKLSFLSIIIGLVAAFIGMRVIILGFCLVFAKFRRWYLLQ
jgi:hypothetical protein